MHAKHIIRNYLVPIPVTITAILIVALCAAVFSGCYNLSKDLRGDLQGKITLRNTEIPVPNVKIMIESLKDSSYFVTYSNENGEFFYRDVHFGVNKVQFEKKNFFQLVKYADVRANQTFKLDVEMREYAATLLIYTTVKVVDALTQEPIKRATVNLYYLTGNDEVDEEDEQGFWKLYSARHTDDEGNANFFLGGIPKKNRILVQACLAASGYEDVVHHFTLLYEEHQPVQVLPLAPLQ